MTTQSIDCEGSGIALSGGGGRGLFVADPLANVVEPDVHALPDFREQVVPNLLEARGDAPARLGDEVDRAELEGFEDVPVARPRGDHDHRRRPRDHDPPEEREAVHRRHLEVEGDHVRPVPEHLLDSVLAVDGRRDHPHVPPDSSILLRVTRLNAESSMTTAWIMRRQ